MARETKQLTATEKAMALYTKSATAIAKGKPLSGNIVLCDTSASMRETDQGNNKTRFELLCQALKTLVAQLQETQYFHFNSLDGTEAFDPSHADEIFPHGATPLGAAIRKMAKLNPKHLLVISDGCPTGEPDPLTEAKMFPGRIDVIYVGPETDKEALRFMQKLATTGGGTTSIQKLSQAQLPAFQNEVRKMLPGK